VQQGDNTYANLTIAGLAFLALVSWCIMKMARGGSHTRVCLVEYDDFLDDVKNHLVDLAARKPAQFHLTIL